MSRTIAAAGFDLLVEFEGFRPFPYPDPASDLYRALPAARWGFEPPSRIIATLPAHAQHLDASPWTQGFGFTVGITRDAEPMSRAEALLRLRLEVNEFAEGVDRLLKREANDHEFAAMVVLAFNIGLAGFARSSVLRAHNAGDAEAAARAFALWNKAGGRVLRGLTRRRAAEAALYLKPVRLDVPVPPLVREALDVPDLESPMNLDEAMPQRIDPERPLRESSIVRGGAVAGGVSGLTLAAEGARAVGEIRWSLGDWLPYAALGVVVLAAGWIIFERVKQRRGGWA